MKAQTTKILTSAFDGTQIPVIFTGPSQPRRCLLMVHGLSTSKNEYLGFYDILAESLAQNGIASLRFDCRGHGESMAPAKDFNFINNIKDALHCINEIWKRTPGIRIDLLGTSFGAPTALCCSIIESQRTNKVYLVAPVLDLKSLYLNPVPERAEKYSNFLKKIIERHELIDVNGHIMFNIQNGIEFSIVDVPSIVSRIQERLTVIHGDADTMIPIGVTQSVLNSAPNAKFHIFPRMDHGFTNLGDEEGTSSESQQNLQRIIDILLTE